MAYTRDYKEASILPDSSKSVVNGNIQTSVNHRLISITGSRSGSKVHDFKEKIRRNEQASSAYTLNRVRIEELKTGEFSGTYRYDRLGQPSHITTRQWSGVGAAQYADPAFTHAPTNSAEAEAMALSKTYKKLDSELSHMNSPAVIAEFLDVLRQFGNPFKSIVSLHQRHLNRLYLERRRLSGSVNFKEKKFLEIAADTWAETSFGLMPLISDTKSVAEALARFNLEQDGDVPPLKKRIVSRGLSSSGEANSYSRTLPLGFEQQLTARKVSTEYRVQYVCGLEGSLLADYGSNERLLQLLGFQPSKWIPAIYEAVPWSWLVDYFTNVGSILTAAGTSTARVKWICKTVTSRSECHFSSRIVPPKTVNGYYTCLQYTDSGSSELKFVRTTVSRTIPTTLSVPPLIVKHPFDDTKKILNMAAVLLAREPSAHALWLF